MKKESGGHFKKEELLCSLSEIIEEKMNRCQRVLEDSAPGDSDFIVFYKFGSFHKKGFVQFT